MTDEEIRTVAIRFAKQNKERIAKEITSPTKYAPDSVPISVFMAGSPGAGKTEFSKSLISLLEGNNDRRVIRIDGDELRSRISGYTGDNSSLFQGAISLIVEKIHDHVLRQKQSFVFDSTFARYEKAVENIERSLKNNRLVFIFYIYQKPEAAWKFTKAREEAEGRNIPKTAFIEQFFGARKVSEQVLEKFGDKVTVFLVKKDFERNTVETIKEIKRNGLQIDSYIKEHYTRDELEKRL